MGRSGIAETDTFLRIGNASGQGCGSRKPRKRHYRPGSKSRRPGRGGSTQMEQRGLILIYPWLGNT